MDIFQYDYTLRQNSTPEKKKQSDLQKISGVLERKLAQKFMDLLDLI